MGLLDDAIREHLDLKRRRGGDPTEIEQAERDALGPVRRGPEPVAADDPDVAGLPYDAQADELWEDDYDEPEFESESESHDPDATALMPAVETPDSPLEPEPPYEPPAAVDPPAAEPPAPASEERARRRPEPDDLLMDDELFADPPPREDPVEPGDETVEYRVEDALAEEGGTAEGEDVLEETPEFLQDTPDHDRLWFEQRPPKDFDFDK